MAELSELLAEALDGTGLEPGVVLDVLTDHPALTLSWLVEQGKVLRLDNAYLRHPYEGPVPAYVLREDSE